MTNNGNTLRRLNAEMVRELKASWLIEMASGDRLTLPFSIGHVTKDGQVLAPPWWIRDRGLEAAS